MSGLLHESLEIAKTVFAFLYDHPARLSGSAGLPDPAAWHSNGNVANASMLASQSHC